MLAPLGSVEAVKEVCGAQRSRMFQDALLLRRELLS